MVKNKKKNRTKSKSKSKKSTEKKISIDFLAVIFISIGIISVIAAYTDAAGILSMFTRNYLYKVFGILIFLVPIIFIYLGVMMWVYRDEFTFPRYISGPIFISLGVAIMTSSYVIYTYNIESTNTLVNNILFKFEADIHGGIIISLVTFYITKLIGFICSCVVSALMILYGLIRVSNKDISEIVRLIKDAASFVIELFKKIPVSDRVLDFLGLMDSTEEDLALEADSIKPKPSHHKPISIVNSDPIVERGDEIELEIVEREEKHSGFIDVKPIEPKLAMDKGTEGGLFINGDAGEVTSSDVEGACGGEDVLEYKLPSIDLLNDNPNSNEGNDKKEDLIVMANKLEETLKNFDVNVKVTKVTKGPSVTRFELQPGVGVKVSKIVNLQDDISLGLAANGVRIEAPIPGRSAVGIEIPNASQSAVYIKELITSKEFVDSRANVAFAIGEDISGKSIVGDLSKMPHMLIAGATGSGKSVCINTIIMSILYKYLPYDVKLILVDPKVVELSIYNDLPHLLIPVVTDPKKAAGALNWAVNEMNRRYALFSEAKVKNIDSFNNLYHKGEIEEKLPFIIIVIDELADLMLACGNEVESYICRLAQMARAAGMHLIIATQRPSTDVITGTIKANIPSRISFAVSSSIDSRTILDSMGAEKLIGKGDMLYYPIGENKPMRVQGCFVSEEEVERVVASLRLDPENISYSEDIINHIESNTGTISGGGSVNSDDELLDQAIALVRDYKQASTSFLQRKLKIGFNRASRLMDELEEQGIISERDGNKPRKILI